MTLTILNLENAQMDVFDIDLLKSLSQQIKASNRL